MAKRGRSINDEEVALIRAMVTRGIEKTKIQAYFTHPDRPVNFGRITNIENNTYGKGIEAASQEEVDAFIAKWGEARGAPVQKVIEDALDIQKLSPIDPRRLASLFVKTSKIWKVTHGETEEVECKRGFHLGSKVLRAVAALANNRGGHVVFGISEDDHSVIGMQGTKFQDTDSSRFSQSIRSAMEPMPRVEIATFSLGGLNVGVLYVHREPDGPVIASKTDQEFREGVIYYRYPGESRAIGAAEFRKLLAERDSRIRRESGTRIAQLMELGPRATIVDLGSQGSEATRIVREGIDEADVLRNFVRQERVEFPLAYLLRSCSTARSWLPVFYYLRLSGLPMADVIQIVMDRETSYVARKRDLISRLKGEKSAYGKASGRVAAALKLLLRGDFPEPSGVRDAGDLALAMTSLPDSRLDFDRLVRLLGVIIQVIRSNQTVKADVWSYVYKAAARIDELYFRRGAGT